MEKTEIKKEEKPKGEKMPKSSVSPPAQAGAGGERPKNKKKRSFKRSDKVRSEFDQKIISIRRVTRVVAGGRRFSFSVAVISGNRKGSVGVGIGKAGDTALAIEKATRDAKKNMIKVPLDKNMSITHNVEAKYNASKVMITPSRQRGLVAGSSARDVLELAGVKDVVAKILSRSKNKLNTAKATVEALAQLN